MDGVASLVLLLSLVGFHRAVPVKVPHYYPGAKPVETGKCLVDGSWYKIGEDVPADKCEYCVCGPGSRVFCLPIECQWPRCTPGDPVVYPPATCCPMCASATICGIFCPWPRCDVGEEVFYSPGRCCPICAPIHHKKP